IEIQASGSDGQSRRNDKLEHEKEKKRLQVPQIGEQTWLGVVLIWAVLASPPVLRSSNKRTTGVRVHGLLIPINFPSGASTSKNCVGPPPSRSVPASVPEPRPRQQISARFC